MNFKLILLSLVMGISVFVRAEENEIRELKEFDRLVVSRGIEVVLTQSDENKALIVSDHMDLENIITEVSGSTLKISMTKLYFTEVMVQVRLNYKMLNNITAKSGAIIRAPKTQKIPVVEIVSSVGSLVEMKLNSEIARVSANKGSVVKVVGNCDKIIAKSSTGSSVYTDKIPCKHVEANANSAGNVYVHATHTLTAKSIGKAVVTVYGEPVNSEASTSLGGKVVFKDMKEKPAPKQSTAKQA